MRLAIGMRRIWPATRAMSLAGFAELAVRFQMDDGSRSGIIWPEMLAAGTGGDGSHCLAPPVTKTGCVQACLPSESVILART
jgi:hypothetical protein